MVIPAFNAAHTIQRALASVRAQTLAVHEIVVVDDASPDGTLEALRRLDDPSLVVVPLDENVGAAEARNRGVAAASGTHVAFLDADDEWLPEKLERQASLIAANPACVLVSCDTLALRLLGDPVRMHERCRPVPGPLAWKALLQENFIPTPTVLARRADILDVGGFDPDLTIGEDLDLWIRLAERGEVEVCSEVLVRTHQRGDSLMRSYPTADADIVLPMIERHVARMQDKLSADERKQILGKRHFTVAYDLYAKGHRRAAVRHALRACRLGHRPLRSLSIALRAALPGARPA